MATVPSTCLRVTVFSSKRLLSVQRGFAAKELEWVHEEDVPNEETQGDAACPYTAAVTAAAGMSEQALAQWMDAFPADGRPELPAASRQSQDKATVSMSAPSQPSFQDFLQISGFIAASACDSGMC